MKVSNQLLRIIKEEIEVLDYGKVTISINVSGPYTEIASEKKIRLIKNELDDGSYHKG
jgi:hypothetical protein